MQETNGEKEHLREQVERLKDERIERLEKRVEENHQWSKSNYAGIESRIRTLEADNFRLAGERTVYGKVVPLLALLVSGAVALMKLWEMIHK